MGVAAPVVPVLDGWLEADRAVSLLRSVTAILEKHDSPVNLLRRQGRQVFGFPRQVEQASLATA